MNRDELLRRAQSAVATRRQRALTLAKQNMDALYAENPRLAALENERIAAGAQLGRLAATGADDASLAEMRAMMDAFESEKQDILRLYPDTQPHFTCKKCSDTGRIDGEICTCVLDLVRAMRLAEVNESSPLELCSFDMFDLSKYPNEFSSELGTTVRAHMTGIYNFCRAYADSFDAKSAQSLYLCGYAGLGKTHLALSIAHKVLEKGYDVVYVSAQDAFDRIEKEKFGGGGETLSTMLSAQLLILDDLGTEYITPFVGSCLYSVINTRANKRMPTIYTSNILKDADLARRYTEKIVSRLLGSCEVLYFCGEDIRIMNSQER
ncbi:MAG: DNA replication protein [Clostridia bacterium]|nr:DNA replication protein [Clostridia bacterium]NLS84997.1 ATP-binding protein [Oscillospiraceae bacterium]